MTSKGARCRESAASALKGSYYKILGVRSSASLADMRQAYRQLSKRYHPDTTELPPEVARTCFQQLKEAYATLSDPEKKARYDRKLRLSGRAPYGQAPLHPTPSKNRPQTHTNNAYLDPVERPLSSGELFSLFVLGATLLGCLLLAIAIGLTRGEAALQPILPPGFAPPAPAVVLPDRRAIELPSLRLQTFFYKPIL